MLAGIYLTNPRRLIYCESVSAFKRDSLLRIASSKTGWQAAASLLLVALLLYNPFFTILSSSRDISVQHPLSYRATLAGSELRRSLIDPATPLIPELDAVLAHAATLFTPSHEVEIFQARDVAGLLSQTLCDSIWFRPPPAA
jgi:hypothetical protein